jgi:PBP1b-binding outer membrane lipoprotein LpoB
MMKRIVKIVAALLLLAFLSIACSQHICPAYTIENEAEQAQEVAKS